MKILFIITITLLTSLSLHGYSKKIILGSFGGINQHSVANVLLDEIEHSPRYAEYRKLAKENGFKANLRQSGEYYILVVEPIKSKTILKQVMKQLKPRFYKAFANNYKKPSKSRIAKKSTKPIKKEKLALKQKTKLPVPVQKKKVQSVAVIKDYNLAKKLFDSKEYEKSYALLHELFLNDLSDPNINFYLGQSAYKLGKYEEALSAYERILIVNEKAYRAKLEMALCYQQLNLPKEAKRILLEVRQDVPQSVQVNIDANLAAIEDKRKKHSFGGAAILGLNYDSNIYGVTVDDVLSDKISNYTLNNEASAGWAHQEVIAANYSYAKSETVKYKTDFVLFNKNIFDYSDMDLNLVQMTPGVSIMYNKKLNVEYALFLNKVWIASNPLMMNTGAFTKLKYIYSSAFVFDLSLKYQSQQNSAPSANRDNNTYNLELGSQHFYTKELSFGAKAKFDFVREKKSGEAGDLNEVAYNLFEITLNSNYKYSPKIMFTPKLKVYQKDYTDPSISPINGQELYKRSDNEYQILLSGTYVYSPKTLFTLEYVHSMHTSNYVDNEFNKDTLAANVIIPF